MTAYTLLPMLDSSHHAGFPKAAPSEKKHFSFHTRNLPGVILTKKKSTSAPSKARPGRAAKALRDMRLKVYNAIPGQKLTLARMAEECGILSADGKPSASSYQYMEESVGEFFALDKVNLVIPPLSRRGIPVAEIKRRLLGEISHVAGNAAPVVRSTSLIHTREVPVVTREAALRILRGDFDIQQLIEATTAEKQWGTPGLVIGFQSVPNASDKTIVFDVLDGSRSQIAVDGADRVLVDGRSYVWTVDGSTMYFCRWEGGVMIAREGPEFGRVLPFDPEGCTILGRVIKWMRDE